MAIPIHDDNPTARPAVVTVLIIAACVFVYAAVQPHSAPAEARFLFERAAVPCEVVRGSPLTALDYTTQHCASSADAAQAGGTFFPHKSVYLALLISMFLHGSWLHLAGNMLFLWIFGNNVEDRLGRAGFVAFYVGCGLAASLGHVVANPSSVEPVVGASGAIAAVMGAYLVWYPRARVTVLLPPLIVPFRLPAYFVLGAWMVMQFFTDPNSGIAWVAHVVGFVAGMLVALALNRRGPSRRAATWQPSPYGPTSR